MYTISSYMCIIKMYYICIINLPIPKIPIPIPHIPLSIHLLIDT